MKKFIVFLASFIFLFLLIEIMLGFILTAAYTPDINGAWEKGANLPQEVVFGGDSIIPNLVLAAVSASAAYFFTAALKGLRK